MAPSSSSNQPEVSADVSLGESMVANQPASYGRDRLTVIIWASILVLIGLAGSAAVLYSTMLGPGVSPDSTVYLGVAESLRNGIGFFIPFYPDPFAQPMLYYPPLYPLSLAAAGALTGSAEACVRYGNALSFGGLIFIVGLLTYRLTHSRILSIIAALLLCCAETMLLIHCWVWSEPPFLFVMFVGVAVFSVYLETADTRYLLAASALFATGTLIRYAGVGFIGALWLSLVLLSPGRFVTRLFRATLFAGGAILPAVMWTFRNRRMAGGAVAFIGFHPPGWQTVNSGLLATIRRWLGTLYHPERASLLLLFVCMVLLIALIGYVVRLVYAGRDGGSYMNGGFASFLAISLIIYLWFVVAVICFLNAITPLDERILSPAFILVLLLVMHAVNTGLLWVKRPVPLWAAIRVPAMALVVFIVSTWYSGTKLVATRFHDDGIGLNSKPWRSSKMIEASSALPADAVIYSNAPDMLYPLTRRRSKGIPRKADIVTKVADPKYPAAISQMRRELSGSNGYIIYFSARPDLPDENELRQLLPLRVIHKSRDGTIYTAQ